MRLTCSCLHPFIWRLLFCFPSSRGSSCVVFWVCEGHLGEGNFVSFFLSTDKKQKSVCFKLPRLQQALIWRSWSPSAFNLVSREQKCSVKSKRLWIFYHSSNAQQKKTRKHLDRMVDETCRWQWVHKAGLSCSKDWQRGTFLPPDTSNTLRRFAACNKRPEPRVVSYRKVSGAVMLIAACCPHFVWNTRSRRALGLAAPWLAEVKKSKWPPSGVDDELQRVGERRANDWLTHGADCVTPKSLLVSVSCQVSLRNMGGNRRWRGGA